MSTLAVVEGIGAVDASHASRCCLACGTTECLHDHHATLRGHDAGRLDPEFRFPLCQPSRRRGGGCHGELHQRLAYADLNHPRDVAPGALGRWQARTLRTVTALELLSESSVVVDLRSFLADLAAYEEQWLRELVAAWE